MSEGEGSQDWLGAALAALADGGIGAVRVEVLAQRLGVTKGGFYRRYRDRRALLDRMLETWVEGRSAAIREQTRLGAGEAPAERLRALILFFAERLNPEALAVELAIRQWARSDAAAAKAAAAVDEARLAHVATLYEQCGFGPAEARAQAVIFYAFIFGRELLFFDAGNTGRSEIAAMSADLLVRDCG
jgi:AcrR family transcriptional regulator